MSFIEKLQACANREVERELRTAIGRLANKVTDVEIDYFCAPHASAAREAFLKEQIVLEGHVRTLRFAIAFMRREGRVFLGTDEEASLRAAKEPRRAPKASVPRHHHEGRPGATVTPAPAKPIGALSASARAARKPVALTITVLPEPPRVLMLTAGDSAQRPRPAPPSKEARLLADGQQLLLGSAPKRRS